MNEDAARKLSWLSQEVNAGRIETVLVAFPDHYGRLMGKRFEAEFFVEHVAEHGTHGCNYLLTTDMEMEPVQGYRFANWELGYGDFHLVPDLSTLRPASWLEKSALVLCDLEDERTHTLVEVAPRTLLKRQLERARALGYTVMAASELEYYLYRVAYREAHRQGYAGLEPAGYYLEDYHLLQGTREEPFTAAVRRHLKASGIPVENSKGEWGLGQHEVNLRYAEALEMADRHAVFKQCLKEIADSMGLSVTFMAKPHHGQAGSSCHIHLSLWKDGQNAFAGEESYGPVKGSKVFGQFLAGWIAHTPDLMPLYAPTVNAYKRYEDGSWAPTRLAWSYDNRTAGFRVVGHGPSLRIECRIGGADLNPYLALAAALASGLDGLEQDLTPPPIFQGDIYQARHLPRVPYTLGEAVEGFAHSAFAKKALGEAAHEHYTHFYRTEWQAFCRAVTDWERKRYFERI
ncbi:MAG: glutamine synthetase family protein [Meiothermus sp.]|uniref:glutamine synthetase family protein n=1 Tax=Meiothermus sp. TaxID=1955249 RepID=UPI0025EB02D3|nr:glutamine synthetase family protein [Meiothermus sp.]MCS7194347.1 glutamine synthetase family protein [Meiothermus sp.]MDW8089828.1 glutamine synthetase family protein [Meiothermus sp.]